MEYALATVRANNISGSALMLCDVGITTNRKFSSCTTTRLLSEVYPFESAGNYIQVNYIEIKIRTQSFCLGRPTLKGRTSKAKRNGNTYPSFARPQPSDENQTLLPRISDFQCELPIGMVRFISIFRIYRIAKTPGPCS